MRLISLFVGVAFAISGAVGSLGQAQAATISFGSQLDITGVVNVMTSDFQPGGNLDFEGDGTVVIATGDFSGLLGSSATMFDLGFVAPEQIWTVGGFSFLADSYFNFDNDFPFRGFEARGTIFGPGFDPTPGVFGLTTQGISGTQVMASFSSSTLAIPLPASVFMLLAALGGLGVLSRRRETATA